MAMAVLLVTGFVMQGHKWVVHHDSIHVFSMLLNEMVLVDFSLLYKHLTTCTI